DEFKSKSEDIKDSLSKVEQNIEEICNMTTFSGETADQAKLYFRDLHLTVLTTFDGVFTDLYENLNKHIETFQSRVDESSSTIIESNYVRDTMEDVSEDYEALQTHRDSVSSTISSISDISSATTPSFVAINNDKYSVINVGDNLQEDLDSFTTTGRSSNSQTEELLKEIKNTLNNAGAVSGKARFTDYKGDSRNAGLAVLKGYNEGIANSGEVDLDSIRYMSMYEIEQLKESALKGMDETERAILNNAFNDLKNGKLPRDKFYNILSVLKSSKNITNNEKLKEEVSDEDTQNLIEYLNDNSEKIERNFKINLASSTFEQLGISVVKNGQKITFERGIKGPSGSKSFVMMDENTAKRASAYSDIGSKITKFGKTIGGIAAFGGFSIGMYDDIFVKNKTAGEAIAHNVTSLAVGAGVTLITGALISNPGGWAILGAAALGTAAGTFFNFAYDTNLLGLQDGLDYVGSKIDKAKEAFDNSLERAGEAIQSGFDAMNPMNWGW
uniref:T7SS effector LXG polymorphic toxin n=1 Tax=Gracilibacillus suaedae TaxID=2820273 RepID=UPI001E352DAC